MWYNRRYEIWHRFTVYVSQSQRKIFDVGMAEEHAVTFSAALAKSDMEPVVCLYSTFMQRAMDQYINDVMLLNLNVMFGIDRAGLVPGDGETHQGIHDIGIFANYKNTIVVCPSNYNELLYWEERLINNVNGPKVLRYSRGGQEENIKDYRCTGESFDLIKSKIENANKNLLVCYGRHFSQRFDAVRKLEEKGIGVDILKLNVVNPIPMALLLMSSITRTFISMKNMLKMAVWQDDSDLLCLKTVQGKLSVPLCGKLHGFTGHGTALWDICGLSTEKIVRVRR